MKDVINQEMIVYKKYKEAKNILLSVSNKLGNIEINNGSIICHVNNRKLKKYLKNYNVLTLKGFNEKEKHILMEAFGVNNPIKYVIDKYHFNDDIVLNTIEDTVIEFNNCTFFPCLLINNIKKIIFNYCDFQLDNGLRMKNANNNIIDSITINRCKFLDYHGKPNIMHGDLIICANEVEIRECSTLVDYAEIISSKTNIYSTLLYSNSDLKLISEKLNIIKATIYAHIDLYVTADNIDTEHGQFYGLSVKMNNNNFDFNNFSNIFCDNNFEYNGLNFKKYNYLDKITPELFELLIQRAILANTLHKVYNKCENDIEEKSNNYKRLLRNKSISDTLGE